VHGGKVLKAKQMTAVGAVKTVTTPSCTASTAPADLTRWGRRCRALRSRRPLVR
jgi:hypothetical protein